MDSIHRKKSSFGMLGKHHSEKSKNKIGLGNKGKVIPEKVKSSISEKLKIFYKNNSGSFKGKNHSLTSRKKMSDSHKGKTTWNKGKKMSPMPKEHRIKISESHKKKVELGQWHTWRGGVTPINQRIRSSLEYRLWREAVFRKDNFTCVFCGRRSGNGVKVYLNADHIKPFSMFPELRFSIDNGRTLCRDCHRKTETYGYNKCYVKKAGMF